MRRIAPSLAALLVAVALADAAAGRGAAAEDYNDATLEAFAIVTIEVSRRIEAWRLRIEGASDGDERDALVEEANADVARALEEAEGIDAEEFQAIYDDARDDETLRARIDGIIAIWRARPRVPRAQ